MSARKMLTPSDHRDLAVLLSRLQASVHETSLKLNGYRNAPLCDLWINAQLRLHSLRSALSNHAVDYHGRDFAESEAAPPSPIFAHEPRRGRRRAPLSLASHRLLGAYLSEIDVTLMHLYVDLANRLGKTSHPAKAAKKAFEAVSKCRCAQDNLSFADYPRELTQAPSLYYGLRTHEQSIFRIAPVSP